MSSIRYATDSSTPRSPRRSPRQLGLPQPVDARAPPRGRAGRSAAAALRRRPRRPPRAAAEGGPRPDQGRTRRRRGQGQGARLRRLRDRRLDRAGRAAALLLPRRRPPRSATAASIVLGTPARRGGLDPGRDRAAGARGLHPLARQGDRRPRRDRAAGLRRRGRRGAARLDAALPALAPLGLRLRPGDRGRHGRRARSPSSTGSGRSPARRRWSPAPRAGSAPRSPRPWRCDGASVVGLDVPQAAAELGRGHRGDRRRRDRARHHRAGGARADRRALRRRRRRRRPQRRRDQGPDDRQDARGALERS